MKKKFVYLFTLNGKIQWSSETELSLPNRANDVEDFGQINDFIEYGTIGGFIILNTSEFIFRTE